jgi:hypothetical protein
MAQPRRGIARRAWHERAAAASAAAPSFFDLAALDAAGPKPHEWVGLRFFSERLLHVQTYNVQLQVQTIITIIRDNSFHEARKSAQN